MSLPKFSPQRCRCLLFGGPVPPPVERSNNCTSRDWFAHGIRPYATWRVSSKKTYWIRITPAVVCRTQTYAFIYFAIAPHLVFNMSTVIPTSCNPHNSLPRVADCSANMFYFTLWVWCVSVMRQSLPSYRVYPFLVRSCDKKRTNPQNRNSSNSSRRWTVQSSFSTHIQGKPSMTSTDEVHRYPAHASCRTGSNPQLWFQYTMITA